MKVYLAGPMAGCTDEEANAWRDYAATRLPEVLSPMVRDHRNNYDDVDPAVIVEGDKADIRASDAVLAYCPWPSVGTSMELLYAYTFMKPTVAVVPEGVSVSPWIRYHVSLVVRTIDEAVDWIMSLQEEEIAA